MNAKQFFEEAVKMRRLQKDYFKTRNPMALNASKTQEKLIDIEIERVTKLLGEKKSEQRNMFD